MGWKVIWNEAQDDAEDLTHSELIGVGIILSWNMGEPYNERNVYYRAWDKLQPAITEAIAREYGEDMPLAADGDEAPKYVIAGNFQQYRRWLEENGKNGREYRYVSDKHDLMGARGSEIVLVGQYWKSEVYSYARLNGLLDEKR